MCHDVIKVKLVQFEDSDVRLILQIDTVMCFIYNIYVMAILKATSLRHCYNIIMSTGYVWSSYLILCFDYLITDFISNWKCSMKDVASWREPHSWQLQTLGSLVFNSLQTQDVNWPYISRPEGDALDVFWTSYVRSIYVLCLRGWVGEKRAQNFFSISRAQKFLASRVKRYHLLRV